MEERYGVNVEVYQGPSLARQAALHGDELWKREPDKCCEIRKVKPLQEALAGVDAWITGLRREQSPSRADTPKLAWDEKNERWKASPLADWTEKDVWRYIAENDVPYNDLHDRGYGSIGCTHCTQARRRARGSLGGDAARPSAASIDRGRPPVLNVTGVGYEISHLRALEAEAIHVMREVAAEVERAVLLFSGGKDSVVLLRLAEKAFHPAKFPFAVMHVDTGHNFPEVLEFRDRRVGGARRAPDRGERAGLDRRGPGGGGDRPARLAQPPPDRDAARRHHRARLPRRLRRRPPRRGARAGQGAHLLLPRRLRRLGSQGPAPRAVEPLQRPHEPGRAHAGVPALQLDRAGRVAVHPRGGARDPVDVLRPHAARCSRATACSTRSPTHVELLPGEEPFEESVRYRTVGDMSCTGAVRSTATTLDEVVAEIAATTITERGETRADDRASEAAMEDRKREGYF